MKISLIYDHNTTNTKLLAESICTFLKSKGHEVFNQENRDSIPEADLYVVGFWTNQGDCDSDTIQILSKMENCQLFLYGTAGFATEEYLKSVIEKAKRHIAASNQVVGTFMCQGKMHANVRERYEAMIEKEGESEKTTMLIQNFDQALSHPDRNDIDALLASLANCL